MLSITGYRVYDTPYQDNKMILYRGERARDDKSVVIKANSPSYPASSFAAIISKHNLLVPFPISKTTL